MDEASAVNQQSNCRCGIKWGGSLFYFREATATENQPLIYLFIFNLFILLIYFWLCWVIVVARGLSLVAVSGGYSSLRASHCSGFSCCRARALGAQASVVVAPGLQELWLAGSRAQAQ